MHVSFVKFRVGIDDCCSFGSFFLSFFLSFSVVASLLRKSTLCREEPRDLGFVLVV